MGADVRLDPAGFDIGIRRSWEEALASVEEAGGKPYAIPAGASDHPLGGHGFVRWADEVAEQEAELGVFFDTIVVCSVTGSTQAGMIAGFAGQEGQRTVLGIDGSAIVDQTREQIARIARRTAEAIGLGRELTDDEIVLLDEWHAGTYGIPDARTIDAIRLCARLEGMWRLSWNSEWIDHLLCGESQRTWSSLRPSSPESCVPTTPRTLSGGLYVGSPSPYSSIQACST